MHANFNVDIPGYTLLEVIGETHYSSVFRALRQEDERTVVIKVLKTPNPSPEQIVRLRHEYELICGIEIEGVIKPVDFVDHGGVPALVLEDFGGIPLKKYWRRDFTLEHFLELVIGLVEILAKLHQTGVTHRDIKPSNILLNPEDGSLRLTDFGISAQDRLQNEEITNPEIVEGTLAYISPEQTGRMDCKVDYRTDLYSLGVTFYEMLTGAVPFQAGDPMEIIHAHIAKTPTPPREVNPAVPEAISNIVMKLLCKAVPERYQHASGLLYDLRFCQQQLRDAGFIEPFMLGSHDAPLNLEAPHHLVGRELELEVLASIINRVVKGAVEAVLVSGEAGIGKSALVKELRAFILEKNGFFIYGKYDQFNKGIPFSALSHALHMQVRRILGEQDSRLEYWREELLKVLGPNGKVMTDVIPDLELIIGKQPEIRELGGEETENRFHLVLKNFVRVFARAEHPLVLFLDDLQWCDSASLKLIRTIMADRDQHNLLFIGTYRDDKSCDQLPFLNMFDGLASDGLLVSSIRLNALTPGNINQLLMSFMHCPPDLSWQLARVIHTKTKGNPFFVHQFLKTIFDHQLLQFDVSNGWIWDIHEVEQMQVTENVMQFMADKLGRLPDVQGNILKICACIGNSFDTEIVAHLAVRPVDQIRDIFEELMQKGLITQETGRFRFQHDRIQEAAYAMSSPEERGRAHYQIGTWYLERMSPGGQPVNLFYLVDQFNHAGNLVAAPDERLRLAGLNLKAGVKAMESASYAAAAGYLKAGCALLEDDAWRQHYELTYALYNNYMKCHYLNGNFDRAEELFKVIIHNAHTKIDKARAYNIMLTLYTNTRSPREALSLGIEALHLFGIHIKDDMGPLPVINQWFQAARALRKIGVEGVLALPEMQDEELLTIHALVLHMTTAAYYVNNNLMAYLSLKCLNENLKYGLSPYVGVPLIVLANLNLLRGKYDEAYRLGEVAIAISERYPEGGTACMVQETFAFFIQHWKKHITADLETYRKIYDLALQSGDFISAGHSFTAAVECQFKLGVTLDEVLSELKKQENVMTILGDPLVSTQNNLAVQWIMALKGELPQPHELSGRGFSQAEYKQQLRLDGNRFGLCVALISEIILLSWFNKYEEALEPARELNGNVQVVCGSVVEVDYYYYYSLIIAGVLHTGRESNTRQLHAALRRNLRKLRGFARQNPVNFQHKYDAAAAGLAVWRGRYQEAVNLYHCAIEGASKQGFVQDEAILCELLGMFYLDNKAVNEAEIYLRRSYGIFRSLGAVAKLAQMRDSFGDLVREEKKPARESDADATCSSSSTSVQALDITTVMQVAQALSGEILLEKLLEKIMHMAVTNAGAQRGYLILTRQHGGDLQRESKLVVNACEDTENGERWVLKSYPLDACNGLSAAMVRYVYHSGKPLILGDAKQKGGFTNDPHVLRSRCRSVLCMPIMHKGQLEGIFYMENNLSPHAFTPERLQLLSIISSQAAISLQNALLYKNIRSEIEVRKETEEALRLSEEKYRSILEEMQDVYCEADLHGTISFINAYGCTISGYTQEELIGANLRKLSAEDVKNIGPRLKDYLNAGVPGLPFMMDLKSKDGSKICLEIIASLVRDKHGHVLGIRGVGRDITSRMRLEEDLLQSYKNVQTARVATILGLAKLAEYRDEATGKHLERIREYARIIASELAGKTEYHNHISPLYIEDIFNSSILHDIGKVGVPDAILLKPGKLTLEEFEVIKTHTTLGGNALAAVEAEIEGQSFLSLGKEIAYHHHEKWDGSGYPSGLKGEEIPLSARIVALADVYDALTSKRTYKEAFTHEQAMAIILQYRGTYFAPDVVDAFLAHEEEFRRIRLVLLGNET